MPLATLDPLLVDSDRFGRSVDAASTSAGLGFRAAFAGGQLPDPFGWIVADDARAFDSRLRRMTGYSDRLEPAAATEKYGIEGALKFDKPLTDQEAAWQYRTTRDRLFREEVLSNTELGPLSIMASSMAGSMLDPAALPLFLAPELLGVGRLAVAVARPLKAAEAIIGAGRLATGLRMGAEGGIEGAIGGGVYEAANYGLRRSAQEDYTGGDALRNILLGAVLGGGFKGVMGAAIGGKAGRGLDVSAEAADLEGGAALTLPEAVDALSEPHRAAAASLAVDRMASDAPVDMGPVLERQRAADLSALDETGAAPALAGRYLDDAVAVTTRGTEIPVRYAVVELSDLVTSHDDDLVRNPDYPGALQPRERERAGAIARNRQLQTELNPKRLMRDSGAETGAPIIAPDGVVESGNGRTIALRRAAAEGTEAWDRYRAELEAQGLPVEGIEQPVLVRVRSEPMTGEARANLAREMNADVTERMSATEQAMSDARSLDDAALALLDPSDPAGPANRPFARAFLSRVAGDQVNSLADEGGRLSEGGALRLRAALTAHAYGDPKLVAAVFEADDAAIRHVGQALSEAAPAWAKMRADMARGLTPPEVEITGNLRAAVDMIRFARDSKIGLGRLLEERLGQSEMFGGALAPETEAMLRVFYTDKGLTRPRKPAQIAAFLNDYARQAGEKTPGPDLFGDTHDGAARLILENLAERLGKDEGGDILQRLRADDAAPAAVVDDGDGLVLDRGDAGRRGDGGGAEGAGEAKLDEPASSRPAKAAATKAGQAMIAADPELAALHADTEALIAREGLTVPEVASRNPDTLAEAVRAAAFCIVEGGLE